MDPCLCYEIASRYAFLQGLFNADIMMYCIVTITNCESYLKQPPGDLYPDLFHTSW